MRYRVGRVVQAAEIDTIGQQVRKLLDQQESYVTELRTLRQDVIYNPTRSAEVGARILDDRLSTHGT
jgi:hypothetical protein